jgi:hypothetical protein
VQALLRLGTLQATGLGVQQWGTWGQTGSSYDRLAVRVAVVVLLW